MQKGGIVYPLTGHSFEAIGTVLWASRSKLHFQGTKESFLLSSFSAWHKKKNISVSFSTRQTLPDNLHEF